MLDLAGRSVSFAMKGFLDNDTKAMKPISNLEQAVDTLQSEITQYLVELSQRDLEREESEELPVLMHCVNDIERVGDHSENIKELAEQKIEEKLPFTEEAMDGLRSMWDELQRMECDVKKALTSGDLEAAERALMSEGRLNVFQEELKRAHVERLNSGQCNVWSGLAYIDLIDNLEKIGDHLTNVAQGIIGGMRWRGAEEEEIIAV
jgi:phosphate:Na+ symporter